MLLPAWAVIAIAAAAGCVLLLLAVGTAKWAVLALGAMAGAAVLAMSHDVTGNLLCAYLFTAPVAISKAVAKGAGIYGPALEITISDLFLFGLVVIWACSRIVRREGNTAFGRGMRLSVIAFFAWAWVSALHAEVLPNGVLSAMNLTKYFFVYIVISELIDSPRRLRLAVVAIGAGICAQVAMATLQLATGSQLVLPGMKTSESATMGLRMAYEHTGGVTAWRPSGLLQHPNFFSDYLVMVLPTLLVLAVLGSRRIGRAAHRVAWVLLVAGTAALVLTLARAGWIAFGVSAVVAVVLACRRGLVPRRHVAALALLAMLGVGAVVVVYPAALYRLTRSDQRSTESRILMMKQALQVVQEHPVIGVGLATYSRAASRHVLPEFAPYGREFQKTILDGVVHNAYLVFWSERGLIGLVITLVLFIVHIRAVLRTRAWFDPVFAALGLGIAASLVGQLVLYNFGPFYLDSRPGVLWAIFGLLTAVLRLNAGRAGVVARAPVPARLVGVARLIPGEMAPQ